MAKVDIKISCGAIPSKDPSFLRQFFTRKNSPKLYRFIEIATKRELSDKSSLPHYYGRTAFYDDDRQLTGKKGPHFINKFEAKTETTGIGEDLVISNKKQVGNWNLFWMLTDGTRWYNNSPKFMHFFDRYGSMVGQPGWRNVQFRRGNERFVPIFHTWLGKQAQRGVDKGVEMWENSGAAMKEFVAFLKKQGFVIPKDTL